MTDDTLSLLTGGQKSLGAPPSATAPDADLDAVVRTAYGEDADHPDAIAAVIYNRAKATGKTLAQIAAEPGQFEAWSHPQSAARMNALDPQSKVYQQIASAVAPVLAGKVDPTGGADSYYNPSLQASLGRAKPQWDNGSGQQIGQQLYFKGAYAPGTETQAPATSGDLLSMLTGGKQALGGPSAEASTSHVVAQPAANAPGIANDFYLPGQNGAPNQNLTPEQVKTFQQLAKAGQLDMNQGAGAVEAGTLRQPYGVGPDGNLPTGPGVYYVDRDGKLKQTEGKPVGPAEGVGMGLLHGVATVGRSIGSAADAIDPLAHITLPGQSAPQADANNAIWQASQQQYGARYGQNGYAGAGDVAGQVAASAPLIASGEGAVAEMGGLGRFVAGQAGKDLGAGAGNLLLRGASLTAKGAAEGAAASGLTSSNSDAPVLDQMASGAKWGAAFGLANPLVKAAGTGIIDMANGLTKPLTESGRNALVMEHLADLAKGGPTSIEATSQIPGVQRTLAQSIPGGNAGVGALERAQQGSDTEFSNTLKQMADANAEARKNYLTTFISSPDDLAAAKGAQQAAFEKNVMAAMGSADASPTQAAMAANKARLGSIFDGVASRTTIGNADQLRTAIGNVISDAQQVLPDSEVQPLLRQVQNISDTVKPGGTISGESYQALTRKGSPLDRAMSSNGNVGFYAGQIREALDDALERSASPNDLAELQQARSQYRNMKIVQAALPTDPGASLDPAKLIGQVRKATPNYAYTGGGALDDAAKQAITAAQSGPVAEQDYLHSLNLTGNNEVPTLNKLNGALKKIANDPSAPVSPDTVNKLVVLRDDLAMDQGSSAGMARGSNTFQNLATNSLTSALSKGQKISNLLGIVGGVGDAAMSHNPGQGALTGFAVKGAADTLGGVYAQKNLLIQQALRNALLDPASVTLDTKVPQGSFAGQHPVISSLLQSNAIPALVDTKNRLFGPAT